MDHQGQYLMRLRRKEVLNSSHYSWEEKVLAEDASGNLGGCMWPPRSYSCSFCQREFRSAQALGGHMNVHRRDRARLKQSLCGDFNNQENSRVSALSNQENSTDYTSLPPCNIYNQPGILHVSDLNLEVEKDPSGSDTSQDDLAETDLIIGLDPVISQNPPSLNSCKDYSMMINCKRLKTGVSAFSFLINACSSDGCSLQPDVNGHNGSMEDIDLELRLGEPPKAK